MRTLRLARLLIALAVFALAGWLLRGYVTDDTYIHLRYARHLLDLGEFSFNPGEATYGATSPLWIFGLALLLKLGMAPLTAAWVLGMSCGAAVIVLLDQILDRMTFPAPWKPALLVIAAGDVWFLRWSYSGMETPLATLLMLALLWPLFSGRRRGWGVTREPLWVRYVAWGALAGLAGLTRPELLLVAPLALPWLLWFEYFRAVEGPSDRWHARPHRPLAAAIAGWLLVVGPWLGYAAWAFGRITPGTASAKSGVIRFVPLEWIDSLARSVSQLAVVQGPLWLGMLLLVALVLYRNRGPGHEDRGTRKLKVGVPLLDGDDEPPPGPGPGVTPLSVWSPVALNGIAFTWTAALLAGYALKQVWIISRYVSPLAPVLLLGMAAVVEWLMNGRRIGPRGRIAGRIVIGASVAVTLALNGWVLAAQVRPHAQQFPRDVTECYGGIGDWLRENTPEDTVIAALDIGAVGYLSERRVLDLMGLVSPEILELGRRIGFQEMVESGAWLDTPGRAAPPDYFVDRAEEPARWAGRTVHGVRFELLRSCTLHGVGLRESQPWSVGLYRLESTESRTSPSDGG